MALNEQFFAALRSGLYNTRGISQQAVDGMNAVCAAFDGFTGHDHCVDDLAAILATVYIETGENMDVSIREVGKGVGKAYGVPAGPYNQVYYGRGPCQITWLTNYTRSEKRLTAPFVKTPDLMLDPHAGLIAMLDGMYAGLFTGVGLRNFITPGVPTTPAKFKAARAIVNGQDKADQYASLCVAFTRALYTGYDKPATATVLPQSPTLPTSQPSPPRSTLFSAIAAWFQGKKGK